jgi:MFS-type transporter involved in bile tolerance (Atg22 family)
VLWSLCRPLNPLRVTVIAAMVAAVVGVVTIPWLREQFDLARPPAPVLVGVAVLLAIVWLAIELLPRRLS